MHIHVIGSGQSHHFFELLCDWSLSLSIRPHTGYITWVGLPPWLPVMNSESGGAGAGRGLAVKMPSVMPATLVVLGFNSQLWLLIPVPY